MKKTILTCFSITSIAFMLAACGNLSDISSHGTSDNPHFPTANQATFSHDGTHPGAWANWEAIRAVKTGLSKKQIYQLIGHPHFGEGFFGVREWDYLFNYSENGLQKQCHLKVLFDNDMIAQTLLWQPHHCQLGSAQAVITLSGDALFDFNKSTLTTEGNISVEQAAKQVLQTKPVAIEVAGYTDPIGSNTYNLRLSQQRAEAVKQRLISLGVTTPITAKGYGKAKQVKACPGLSGSALHDCLKPNRRVEILY